jgi:arylsulfatase A-like enzyme
MNNKPNILLINVDDLGWTDLGFMGSKYYETPTIDKLAGEGMIFTNAYASAANCAPSRACMLTGQGPTEHGVYTVGNSDRGEAALRKLIPYPNKTSIKADHPTFASCMKEAGYTTGMVGKWHLSDDPCEHGFEFNIAGCHHGHPPTYFSPYNIPTLQNGPDGEYLPERLSDEVCDFLESNKENPFMLYYSTYLVHTPIEGKADQVEYYKKKKEEFGEDENHYNPVYAAMIHSLDIAVGKVLDKLEELELKEKTMVIFISDNGGIRAISKQKPLKGGKGSYYEGGIRVPLIIRYPQMTENGSICHTPVTNMDFFPTFLELSGASVPEGYKLAGKSILSLLSEKNDLEKRDLIWHFPVYLQAYDTNLDEGRDPLFRTRPGSVIRSGKWKLHQYFEDNALELYNLENDIGERNNLIGKHPDIAEKLLTKLQKWQEENKAPICTELNPEYDEKYDMESRKNAEKTVINRVIPEKEYYEVLKFID